MNKNITLFNNHLYVIRIIKQEEKEELVKIAQEHNLKIAFPNAFLKEKCNLTNHCIDDQRLGGHLMAMIRAYEMSVVKNREYRVFENVKELKEYIKVAQQRIEPYFLEEDDTNHYVDYLKSLSKEQLLDEFHLINNIRNCVDCFYLATKEYIDKEIVAGVKKDINDHNCSFGFIYKHLNKIVGLRDKIDDFLDNDIYLVHKNIVKNNNIHLSSQVMENRLIYLHHYIHSYNGSYSLIKAIDENIDIIFNVFNYKLKAESIISYDHKAYKCFKKLGYVDQLPDYLVGNKVKGRWDYNSVFKRLLYSLKIYDCHPLLSNKLIPLCYKSREEIVRLVDLLKKDGYQDPRNLSNVLDWEHPPIGVIVESQDKIVRPSYGITVMACLASSRHREDMCVSEFIENYDKLVANYDFVFLNLLLMKITKKKQKEGKISGIFSIKEAEKINNERTKELIKMIKESKESE